MAQHYYDWTGVLVLRQVTAVIQALFGGADLDASNPGNGQAYIAGTTDRDGLCWDEIHEALAEIAEDFLGLEVTDLERECMKACAVLLAKHFGHSEQVVLDLLDGQDFDDDAPDLMLLFALAQLFDDGHGLSSIETEGASHCSEPLLHEFGGFGLFVGKHVVVQRSSSAAIADGSGLESALAAGDLDRAVQQLLVQVEGRLEEVTDDAVRATLRERLAGALISPQEADVSGSLPVSVPVKHWAAYDSGDVEATHMMDVEDHRQHSGQVYLSAGQREGDLDQMLSVTMEIASNPLNGIDQVPCAHIHFDADALAFSAFRLGSGIVLRPEVGVTFRSGINPSDARETLLWVE